MKAQNASLLAADAAELEAWANGLCAIGSLLKRASTCADNVEALAILADASVKMISIEAGLSAALEDIAVRTMAL